MILIRRVLCPIDLSDDSRHVLDHAAAFARWYEARIIVVHTFTAPRPLVAVSKSPGDVPLLPPVQPEEVVEDVRRFCEPLTAAGVTPEIVVREGSPAREIVEVAQAMDADFLIMGTHGRSGFERLRLGSVTEKVLRTVRCPVLTVPQLGEHSAPRRSCSRRFSALSISRSPPRVHSPADVDEDVVDEWW